MRVTFQNLAEAQQTALVHPMTMEVLVYIRDHLWPKDKEMHFNEIARRITSKDWNPNSWHCHGPLWRAADISLLNINMPEEKRIVAGVEEKWIYDPVRPSKPVALVHEPRHLHIQTHPNTRMV